MANGRVPRSSQGPSVSGTASEGSPVVSQALRKSSNVRTPFGSSTTRGLCAARVVHSVAYWRVRDRFPDHRAHRARQRLARNVHESSRIVPGGTTTTHRCLEAVRAVPRALPAHATKGTSALARCGQRIVQATWSNACAPGSPTATADRLAGTSDRPRYARQQSWKQSAWRTSKLRATAL